MRFILFLLIFITVGCCQQSKSDGKVVNAWGYPERSVEIIIPFGEGGASDIFVRNFSKLMEKDFPYGISFSNITGLSGLYAMQKALRKPADGYTILEITPSNIIADIRSGKRNIINNFVIVANVQSDDYIISFSPKSKYKTFAEMMEKEKGKTVYISGTSMGGLDSIVTALLAKDTGIDFRLVPYKSGAESKTGIMSGETSVYLDKVISVSPMLDKGLVQPVLVLSGKRLKNLEEVPCSADLGLETKISSWRTFLVRKETAKDIRKYLTNSMQTAMKSEGYRNMMLKKDYGASAPEQSENFLVEQYAFFEKIIEKIESK